MRKNNIIEINPNNPEQKLIQKAVQILILGGVIIFPTDTIYGIGCDIFNRQSVLRIFDIKKRPLNKALSINISKIEQLYNIVDYVPQIALDLINKHWPGALTLIFKKAPKVLTEVSGGLDSIGVRMPNNKVILDVIDQFGGPIVSTSANISGENSCSKFEEVKNDIGENVDLLINGGDCEIGVESTIVDLTDENNPKIVRQGAIKINI